MLPLLAMVCALGACLPGAVAGELPYSNSLSVSPTDWTLENAKLAPGGGLTRNTGAGSNLFGCVNVANTATWYDTVVTSKVLVDPNLTTAYNPGILSAVSDDVHFYMYRMNTNKFDLYWFNGSASNQLLVTNNFGVDESRPVYMRLYTLREGGSAYLLGEASYDADFSTLINRMKHTTNMVLLGTSAGVRSQVANSYPVFSDFSVETFNMSIWKGSGGWATGTNWAGGIPNAAGEMADFSFKAAAQTGTVNVGETYTVGKLAFGDTAVDTDSTWTLNDGTLTLDSGVAGTNAHILVEKGTTVTINTALTSAGEVTVDGGGTATITAGAGVHSWKFRNVTVENSVLGTGQITLGDGATFASTGGQSEYSNDFVINGNCTLNSAGLTLSGRVSLDSGNLSGSGSTPNVAFENALMGTGTVAVASTMQDSSTLAPGDTLTVDPATGVRSVAKGIGTLTFSNGLTLTPGSVLEMDLGAGVNDTIALTGTSNTLDLTGTTLRLNFLQGFDAGGLEMGDEFEMLTGANFVQEALPTLVYDPAALAGAYDMARFVLTFDGGTLNLLGTGPEGSAVPEPGALALLVMGVAGVWIFVRRSHFGCQN